MYNLQDLWFLPNAPVLIRNQLHRKVIEDLLVLVQLRNSISESEGAYDNNGTAFLNNGTANNETTAEEKITNEKVSSILLDAVINDSCAYVSYNF